MTARQVASHIYKEEIAEIARRISNGSKPGEINYLSAYQGAVSELIKGLDEEQVSKLDKRRAEWINESFPIDVQRKTADRMGSVFLRKSAETQYKEMGMRSIVWEFHENKVGSKLFQVLSVKFSG